MQDELNDIQYTQTEDPDILKVTRCPDCRYSERHVLFNKEYLQCNRRFESYGINIFVNPYDYCSYGERKDE